jgi:transposase
MIKCGKAQIRQLKTALRWKIPAVQRQRIQMVLLRESGMAQPAIAAAMGVSLSTVNRAHMAYDHGGIKALKPKPSGGRQRENMGGDRGEGLAGALRQGRRGRRDVEHPRSQGGL